MDITTITLSDPRLKEVDEAEFMDMLALTNYRRDAFADGENYYHAQFICPKKLIGVRLLNPKRYFIVK